MPMRPNVCVYCGAPNPSDKDHVPPKNIFIPRPAKLIKVPACKTCNQGASKDDEYFRLAIVTRFDADDHPGIDGPTEAVLRSLDKPEASGLFELTCQSVVGIDLQTPEGASLGTAPGFRANLTRLSRVVRRTVKGLFWHEFGRPLPQTYDAVAWKESGIDFERMPLEMSEQLRARVATAQASARKTVGDGVFAYWVAADPEDGDTTSWVLVFFNTVRFIGFTYRKPPQA
jgi:hypothetical protein